jgi:hypothetical protein
MPTKRKRSKKMHAAFIVTWTESERGWGCRPDGASLHLTRDDVTKYIKKYWDGMQKEVPYEYSRPDQETGSPVTVSTKLYKTLVQCKKKYYGYYMWQWELNDALKAGGIKE